MQLCGLDLGQERTVSASLFSFAKGQLQTLLTDDH
jgi:hypothetical protein